jgi:hypothetical protein
MILDKAANTVMREDTSKVYFCPHSTRLTALE